MMLRLREEHENRVLHALPYFFRRFSQESLTGTTGLLACSKPPAGRPPARPDQPRPGHCAPTAQSPRHDVPPQIPGQTPDKPQDSERQESHGRRNPKIISLWPSHTGNDHLGLRGGSRLSARIILRDKLPFPVHSKVILTRDGVVLSFVPSFHSVQPCELL